MNVFMQETASKINDEAFRGRLASLLEHHCAAFCGAHFGRSYVF